MAGVTYRDKDMVVHIHVPDGETYFVVDGKRIYMSFHNYCGPSFYLDKWHDKQVNYDDYPPEHKLWEHFGRWHKKYEASKKKKQSTTGVCINISLVTNNLYSQYYQEKGGDSQEKGLFLFHQSS